ncbi:hypothetical protein SS50377_22369 [Spironucleus salmonicida]|uniref:KOW domain-containing protein n=1 Tax=Spironucleus salmonicida TaxID=348837 RepID=V6LEL1_9EUKA|nr:hypothetical protein SS50377_22369 [Spironucleus salmonicida]|eukprot:EST42136.1 hypothetical protein SS50377_18443 [Spironucleus salmonicida]
MAPGKGKKIRKTEDSENSDQESISGDDIDGVDEYSDESASASAASDSFIAGEEDDLYQGRAVDVNELRRLDREREIKERDNFDMRKMGRVDNIIDDVETIIKVEEEDPYLYKIPIRRGTGYQCLAELTRILAYGEHTKNTEYTKFSAEVFGAMVNPRDPESLYVEAHSMDQVELLAGQGALRGFVQPFKRYYGRQPVTSRPVVLREIKQVRRAEQPQVTKIKAQVVQTVKKGDYKIIKRAGFQNTYGGALCVVHTIDQQSGQCQVLTLTCTRSLELDEKVAPHRIKLEQYVEMSKGDQYFKEEFFSAIQCTFFQGLLVLPVKVDNLRDPTPEQLATKHLLQTVDNSQQYEARQSSTKDSSLCPLVEEDTVVIREYTYKWSGEEIDLAGQFGIVKKVNPQNLSYSILILDQDSKLYNQQISLERIKMNKYIKEGRRVKIISGPYENVIGVLRKIEQSDDGRFLMQLTTDIFNEILDKSCQIYTDQAIETTDTFTGFMEKIYNGVLFARNQMVNIPAGTEAIITNLSYTCAQVVTIEDELIKLRLDQIQPIIARMKRIVKDGSSPPQAVALASSVRVKKTDATGKVIGVTNHNVSSILFIKLSTAGNTERLGVTAIDSRGVLVEDPGYFVDRSISSKNDSHRGRRVRVMAPSWIGREGIVLSMEGNNVKVRLSERDISVPSFQVQFIETNKPTAVYRDDFGMSQNLSNQSHGQLNSGISQFGGIEGNIDYDGTQQYGEEENYGGFEQ